jgi:L-alanine-DL-glutamate epimerase-like enolase superfamily enzyme
MMAARAGDRRSSSPIRGWANAEWRKIADYAAAHSLPMAPHGNPHVGAVCVGGVSNGMIVEVGLYAGRKPARPPIVQPVVVQDSFIWLGEEPGIGYVIDRDAIRWNLQHT